MPPCTEIGSSGPPPVLVGITACMVCTALSSLGVGRWHEKMWRQRRADADVLASALRREAEEEILNASMAASSAMDTARDESDMSFVVESADDEDETMQRWMILLYWGQCLCEVRGGAGQIHQIDDEI